MRSSSPRGGVREGQAAAPLLLARGGLGRLRNGDGLRRDAGTADHARRLLLLGGRAAARAPARVAGFARPVRRGGRAGHVVEARRSACASEPAAARGPARPRRASAGARRRGGSAADARTGAAKASSPRRRRASSSARRLRSSSWRRRSSSSRLRASAASRSCASRARGRRGAWPRPPGGGDPPPRGAGHRPGRWRGRPAPDRTGCAAPRRTRRVRGAPRRAGAALRGDRPRAAAAPRGAAGGRAAAGFSTCRRGRRHGASPSRPRPPSSGRARSSGAPCLARQGASETASWATRGASCRPGSSYQSFRSDPAGSIIMGSPASSEGSRFGLDAAIGAVTMPTREKSVASGARDEGSMYHM